MSTQYGFYVDFERCTGCKTCDLACKDYKNLSPPVSFRRIYEYTGGDWQQAATLIPDYGLLMAGRLVLLVLCLAFWLLLLLRGKTLPGGGLAFGMLWVLCGELIGRAVFYGLHMTVGMEVAG